MAEAKTKPAAQKAAPKAAAPKKVAAAKPAETKKPVEKVAKPAVEKKAAAPKKPAAPKKAATPKKAPAKHKPGPQELYHMIETAAYFIAERNGFVGDSKVFWAEAEAQIHGMLG